MSRIVAQWLPPTRIKHPWPTRDLTPEPKTGAQCVSSARWDLRGGPPEGRSLPRSKELDRPDVHRRVPSGLRGRAHLADHRDVGRRCTTSAPLLIMTPSVTKFFPRRGHGPWDSQAPARSAGRPSARAGALRGPAHTATGRSPRGTRASTHHREKSRRRRFEICCGSTTVPSAGPCAGHGAGRSISPPGHRRRCRRDAAQSPDRRSCT